MSGAGPCWQGLLDSWQGRTGNMAVWICSVISMSYVHHGHTCLIEQKNNEVYNMDTKEFKKVAAMNRPRLRFSDSSYGKLPWEDWYKLTGMTNSINYGCYFHGGGACVRTRREKQAGNTSNKMCCCNLCANNMGYLDFVQNDPKVLDRIADHFKPKIGFWREGKGCILPRKYRSTTCLGYRCEDALKTTINNNAAILIAFLNSIRSYALGNKGIYNLGRALVDINV